jgi:hypothetical protein
MKPNVRYRLAGAHIISDTIEGEAIIVDLNSGVYYSLEGPGAVIWSLVSGGMDEATLVQTLATLYSSDPVEIAAASRELVTELVAEGLILTDSGRGAPTMSPEQVPAVDTPRTFSRPTLNKYDDMADLLLLDPIHEVDEAGWPHAQPGEDNR